MRYRLRTLLIVLALGPPILAGVWLGAKQVISAYCARLNDEWIDVAGPGFIYVYDGPLCTLTIENAADDDSPEDEDEMDD